MAEVDWFGDLYFDSTADLLTPALSVAEARAIEALLRLRPGERVLDLGCGHGRHLRALEEMGYAGVGLDRSATYLGRAAAAALGLGPTSAAYLRADLRALPLATGCLNAAYSWYSSLFGFDDRTNRGVLAEAARVLCPGGRLLVQHANPLALARTPVARAARDLPGGGQVEEISSYDAASGRETLRRILTRGGTQLAGSCELRYYNPNEWTELARESGFLTPRLASTGRGGLPAPFDECSIDLIAVLEKPT